MNLRQILLSGFLISSIAASAAMADSGPRHYDQRSHRYEQRHDDDRRHDRRGERRRDDDRRGPHDRWARQCPPGLARKGNGCVPPGHYRDRDRDREYRHHRDTDRDRREYRERRSHRVGDRFYRDEYRPVRDPRRYNLQQRENWQYYQDDNNIYQVDSKTQRILSVINVLQALQR